MKSEAPYTDSSPSERVLTTALGCAAFLFFMAFNHGHFTGTDEVAVFEMTRSIAQRGDLSIPPIQHTAVGPDGRRYSFFSPGQSVLALPLFGLAAWAEKVLPYDVLNAIRGPKDGYGPNVFGGEVEIAFATLFSPIASALLVVIFFRFERRLGVSLRNSLIAASLLATTTYVTVLSTYFLRHSSEAAAILGAFFFFHRFKHTGALRHLAIGASLASLAPVLRVPASVAAPALAGYLAWVLYLRSERLARPRVLIAALPAILVPLLAAAAFHMTVNYLKWGTLIESPMVAQYSRLKNPIGIGLYGFLLSPGASVFVYTPLLLLLPFTLPLFWREHRAELLAFGGLAVVLLLFFSKFDGWEGLWSAPGPRYLFLWTPFLMLPLGPWLDRSASLAKWFWVAALGLAGFFVQFVSTVVKWGSVPRLAHYTEFEPRWSFLFIPQHSPIAEMTRLLAQGGPIDPWLWRLAQGWTGFQASPLAALAISALWLAAIAALCALMRREVRRLLSAG
jgi:hypothetical protein